MMRLVSRHLFLILLILTGLLPVSAIAADAGKFFDASLGDFKAELADALGAGKKGVLLVFETDDCPFCRRMKDQVLSRDDVQAYYRKHFSVFSVNMFGSVTVTDFAGKSLTEKEFAAAQLLRGTPTFVFVGPGGKEMTRYIGATRDAREFMELGRYVAEGHWRKTGFGAFYPGSGR